MKRAEKILEDNIDKLHNLANALLEREILDGEEVDKVLRGEALPPLERKNGNGTTAPIPGSTVVSAITVIPGHPVNGGRSESKTAKPKTRSKKQG